MVKGQFWLQFQFTSKGKNGSWYSGRSINISFLLSEASSITVRAGLLKVERRPLPASSLSTWKVGNYSAMSPHKDVHQLSLGW